MTELIDFLRARVVDDKRLIGEYEAYMLQRAATAGSYVPVEPPGWRSGEPFDIDRMLREVEAKQGLLSLAEAMMRPVPTPVGYPEAARRMKLEVEKAEEEAAAVILRILAVPYAARPDFPTGCTEMRETP